ncbi:antitoxin [Actinoplanes solisilvae]|uniref:antitoxin n=1 Tax=Actinoplanes solisilvae TaxID=2486853 RepID=UPI000FD98394|nr:antitoxin [Actinoplanes solisilvae]
MKISVSLPDSDVAFLDAQGTNRSAVLHQAVQLLRRSQLDEQYEAAFDEFEASGEQALWDNATADGLPS